MKTFFTRIFFTSNRLCRAKKIIAIALVTSFMGISAAKAQTVSVPSTKAPIAIPFHLNNAGYVTLVIEDSTGYRVRNLISETWFEAGADTAWWDGTDDLGRDIDASKHGVYHIPARFVKPGNYKVRGLVRGEIKPKYEFSPYNTGNPPWATADHVGGWLANHSAPMSAVYVPAYQSPSGQPAVLLGCYVTEGPDGLAWVDLDGKKLGGKKWVGGNWTAAPYMARDAGSRPISTYKSYVASVWTADANTSVTELRVNALTAGTDQKIVTYSLGATVSGVGSAEQIGGLAVYNGIIVVSLPYKNQLVFINARTNSVIGTSALTAAKGLAFDTNGYLLALTERKLVRYNAVLSTTGVSLPVPEVLVSDLLAPVAVTLDANSNFYISDRGTSHQIKVYSPTGSFIRAIGHAGTPQAGPYDPLHMNNPAGITIDSRQQLWVTEEDFLPKRVSIWTLDGTLVKAFYGPAKYGGGGTIDSQDKTRFYYSEEEKGAMEFKLDWATGTDELKQVIYRPKEGDMKLGFRSAAPENAFYRNGTRYFTNCYSTNPVSGHPLAFLFIERNGVARPVAAMGKAANWDILSTNEFKSFWPAGVNLASTEATKQAFFIWTDANADEQVQPAEITYIKGNSSGVTVMPDLSFCIAYLDGKSMQFIPTGYTGQGVPNYDVTQGKVLADGVLTSASSGGSQALAAPDGWSIVTLGMKPYTAYSLSGTKDGVAKWSYPSMWPGLHASHSSPKPEFRGELIGTTRLLGGFIEVDAGKLWAINGNQGNVYLFTSDGLFVATLFEDVRNGIRWTSLGSPVRGMSLDGLTLQDENFWPTITQTPDGLVYLTDGGRTAVLRLDGINNIQRINEFSKTVTTADLEKSADYLLSLEQQRQDALGEKSLSVVMSENAPVVDGLLTDWSTAVWSDIDKRGVSAYFNADSKPYDVTGSLKVANGRLYAAYRTGDNTLLKNSGAMPIAPFKTGGALDLMVGINPAASPTRTDPVEGDMRLLVTIINAKPYAMLYRAVVNGTQQQDKVPFSSPWRTITFDKVDDISTQVQLAGVSGDFELSVPLTALGLTVQNGLTIKGDLGILRGDGNETTSRTYWSNKATSITADVPSEAMLTPSLWGTFKFISEASLPVSLLSFTGKNQTTSVALNWSTTSELNNSHFDVLRSDNAQSFLQIGKVTGSNNSSSLKNYNFLDQHPYSGINYYQLSQVDYNGTATKSPIISVTTAIKGGDISMFIKDQSIKLTANSNEAKDFQLFLTDLGGRVLARFSNKLIAGNNVLSFPVENLAPGVYLVTFWSSNDKITTKQFVD